MSRLAFGLPLALLLATGCVDEQSSATVETSSNVYLFGYTADELLAIKVVTQRPMTDEAWLDAHRGDFSCSRYVDLCKMIGEPHARRAIEEGYRIALATGDVNAVRAAQNAIVAEGKVARAAEPDKNFRDVEDDCEFGTSDGSYRLCASATASQMWPSGEFRADGYCKTQVNAFGWQVKNSDFIDGTLTATFFDNAGSDVDTRSPAAVLNDNRLNFAEFQQSANSVNVVVECEANDGPTWSASADVTNFTT